MLRQWSGQSGQAPGEAEPPPAGEELWEQEMERLYASRAPVRTLPYAIVDKRFIRWVAGRAGAVGVEGLQVAQSDRGWKTPAARWRPLPGGVGRTGDSGASRRHPIPGTCGSRME